jgi:hypothetical protein
VTRLQVLVTIASLTERFEADWAAVGLFAAVNALEGREVEDVGYVMLLSTYQMVLESICAVESLSALFTAVASLSTMNQAMLVEDRASEEAFAAERAQERSGRAKGYNFWQLSLNFPLTSRQCGTS